MPAVRSEIWHWAVLCYPRLRILIIGLEADGLVWFQGQTLNDQLPDLVF